MKITSSRRVIRHTVFVTDNEQYDPTTDTEIEKFCTETGGEFQKIIRVMDRSTIYDEKKLIYLDQLIKKISHHKKFLLPVFLLRCQFVEFSFRHLLLNYPYPPKEGYKNINKLTLGQLINAASKLKDSYLDDIIKTGNEFLELRNKFNHHFLDPEVNLDNLNIEINAGLKLAAVVEKNILFFFSYIEDICSS